LCLSKTFGRDCRSDDDDDDDDDGDDLDLVCIFLFSLYMIPLKYRAINSDVISINFTINIAEDNDFQVK